MALKRLLDLLRHAGAMAAHAVPLAKTPAQPCTDEFGLYVRQERARASTTVTYSRECVSRFLRDRFAGGPVALAALEAADVIGCVDFVSFLEQQGTASITTALAVEGAQPPSSARARPSLYTDAEVRQLLEAALHLAPAGAVRAWTDHARLGLLAVTGLRIREALGLTLEDADVRAGVLTVRGPKCGTSRLVPRQASPPTISSSRDTFRLLCLFTQPRRRKPPSRVALTGIDAPRIVAFLAEMEQSRGMAPRRRHLRLTAIGSFFQDAACEAPAQSVLSRFLRGHSRRASPEAHEDGWTGMGVSVSTAQMARWSSRRAAPFA